MNSNNCLPGTAWIRWRYKEEDWQKIEGDNYEITQQTGQCIASYQARGEFKFQSAVFQGLECGNKQYWVSGVLGKGKIINLSFDENIDYQFCKIKAVIQNAQGEIETHYVPVSTTGDRITWQGGDPLYYFDQCTHRGSRGGNDFVIKEIRRTDRLPDDCGDCVFTITLNGNIVHTETRETCPEVKKYCQQDCPDWTCKCTQGNRVCCYDPNGRVVKSFLL